MKIFCERLKELRLEENLSILKLSKALGVSDTTVLRWENETISPTIEHLYNMAMFFNVSADYLLGISSSKIQKE